MILCDRSTFEYVLYVFLIPLASQRLPFTSPVSEFGEWVEKERVGKKIETESET